MAKIFSNKLDFNLVTKQTLCSFKISKIQMILYVHTFYKSVQTKRIYLCIILMKFLLKFSLILTSSHHYYMFPTNTIGNIISIVAAVALILFSQNDQCISNDITIKIETQHFLKTSAHLPFSFMRALLIKVSY